MLRQKQRSGDGSFNVQGTNIYIATQEDSADSKGHPLAAGERTAMYELPTAPEVFVGRHSELHQVISLLSRHAADGDRGRVSTVSLIGEPGVGKTAFALIAAHRIAHHFPDGQLFFELKAHSPEPASYTSGASARNSWLQRSEPEARLPDAERSLAHMYRQRLLGRREGTSRVLVVIDDPRDVEDVEALAPPPGGAMIITSRRTLHVGHAVQLQPLDVAEARDLLVSLCPRLASEAQTRELAQLCGGLPLALVASGASLFRKSSKPIDEFIDELRQDRLGRLSRSASDDKRLDVEAVLRSSLHSLVHRERVALERLVFLPAEFDREAGSVLGNCEPGVLDELADSRLLLFRAETGRFAVHDLVKEFLAKGVSEEHRASVRLDHARHYIGRLRRAFNREALWIGAPERDQAVRALVNAEREHFDAAFAFLSSDAADSEDLREANTLIAELSRIRDKPVAAQIAQQERAQRQRRRRILVVSLLVVAASLFVLAVHFVRETINIGSIHSPRFRDLAAYAVLYSLAGAILLRQVFYTARFAGAFRRRVLLVGAANEAIQLLSTLRQFTALHFEVVGYLPLDPNDASSVSGVAAVDP